MEAKAKEEAEGDRQAMLGEMGVSRSRNEGRDEPPDAVGDFSTWILSFPFRLEFGSRRRVTSTRRSQSQSQLQSPRQRQKRQKWNECWEQGSSEQRRRNVFDGTTLVL